MRHAKRTEAPRANLGLLFLSCGGTTPTRVPLTRHPHADRYPRTAGGESCLGSSKHASRDRLMQMVESGGTGQQRQDGERYMVFPEKGGCTVDFGA